MSIDTSTDAANMGAVFGTKHGVEREDRSTHYRILLVFNQAHIARLLKTQLDQTTCLVYTARSAESALEMIHAEKFDAVVIDAELSGMGAAQLCMNINRQMRHTKPQLLLTGVTAIELAAQRTDWPINAQGLAWPISVAQLVSVIEASAIEVEEPLSASAFTHSKVRNQR